MLLGRVGKDPEIRQVGEGKVSSFSIATTESKKDSNGKWQNVTEWFNVERWGDLKWVKKGDLVHVDGKLEIQKYEEKYYTKCKAFRITLVSRPGEKESPSNKIENETKDDDYVPF